MNTKPLVTIITPTHNHEEFIEKCLASVLNQSFKDWEMILIDDHSTDKTWKIVKELAKNESRINLLRHEKKWGIGKLVPTYNQALKLAKGRYVAILEGDDFWPKDKLEKEVGFLTKNKNAVLSYGNCIFTNVSSLPIKLHSYEAKRKLLNNKPRGAILRLFSDLRFSIIPVTVVIQTKALKELGGFQKDKYYPFADIPIFLKLALKGEFLYQDEVLGFYRKQATSEWFSYASQTSAMGREELKTCIEHFMQNNIKNSEIRKVIKDGVLQAQDEYIEGKKKKKFLSLILNRVAFTFPVSPLILIFAMQYLLWRYKK